MRDELPHIIHVGFAKCASTYLQEWFAQHPQVSFKYGGLAGMYGIYDLIDTLFDRPSEARCMVTSAEQIASPTDPALFGRLLTQAIPNARELMVELSRRLAKMYPDARVLIITRNHKDLKRSGISQIVRVGRLGLLDEMKRLENQAPDPARSTPNLRLMPYDYDHALALYSRDFGGRVLALPYELLVDDEPEFIRRVAEFLDVDPILPKVGKVNAGLTDAEIYFYPRFAHQLQRIAKTPRLAAAAQKFHTVMINRGGWKPVIALLRLLGVPRHGNVAVPAHYMRRQPVPCPELLKSEVYAPYRDRYMPPE